MDENAMLSRLEELAQSLGVKLRYEHLKNEGPSAQGGLCRIRGEYVLIINSKASTGSKIQAMASSLNRFDLNGIYLRPGLREFLDKYPKQAEPILSS